MLKVEMAKVMEETFSRLRGLREAGQKEYAHTDQNAFANFERVAEQLNLDRKQVLWTYLFKHLDGIVAYINGHRSQRESVHGRIDDVHVYLELLRGMIIEDGDSLKAVKFEDLDLRAQKKDLTFRLQCVILKNGNSQMRTLVKNIPRLDNSTFYCS